MKSKSVTRLVESGLLLALATVLSIVKLVDLPYGGSITAASMLPIVLIAYRHGVRGGLVAATAYSLIQLLLGMNTLSYVTTPLSIAAVILLDYVVAFAVFGLGGIFRKGRPQGSALVLGILTTGALRYVCHVISGCTVWAGLSIPTSAAFIYSLAYNATYMIPEIIILALGAVYISRVLSFENERITRSPAQKTASPAVLTLSVISKTALLATAVWAIVLIAPGIQNADSGELFLAGLAAVSWKTVGLVSLCGSWIFLLLELIASRIRIRQLENK